MKITLLLLVLVLFCGTSSAQVTSYTFDPNNLNKTLVAQLDSIYKEDQDTRMQIVQAQQAGVSRDSLLAMVEVAKKKDLSNIDFMVKFIDKHGWLGPEVVGIQGVQSMFLVIQHADLSIQKKYYPLILKAEQEGKILSSNVAILEDRMAIREGRPQQYGSQFRTDEASGKNILYPVEDVDQLDDFRKSRGLPPMKDYLPNWTIADYRADLAKSEAFLKSISSRK